MKGNAESRKRTRASERLSMWLLWLSLLLALPAALYPAEAALRIGSALPPVTLPGVDGAPVRIPESVKGKVVILHFWQIGCSVLQAGDARHGCPV